MLATKIYRHFAPRNQAARIELQIQNWPRKLGIQNISLFENDKTSIGRALEQKLSCQSRAPLANRDISVLNLRVLASKNIYFANFY